MEGGESERRRGLVEAGSGSPALRSLVLQRLGMRAAHPSGTAGHTCNSQSKGTSMPERGFHLQPGVRRGKREGAWERTPGRTGA